MFPPLDYYLTNNLLADVDLIIDNVKHLTSLVESLDWYLMKNLNDNIENFDWIRNSFDTEMTEANGSLKIQFNQQPLTKLWIKRRSKCCNHFYQHCKTYKIF